LLKEKSEATRMDKDIKRDLQMFVLNKFIDVTGKWMRCCRTVDLENRQTRTVHRPHEDISSVLARIIWKEIENVKGGNP
jgi:hypothetical protein